MAGMTSATIRIDATGYDSVHLWCERFRIVVIDPCGCWQRGAGCDEPER